MSARFFIGELADGSTIWAAADPDSRCPAPAVASRRFPAFLTPFQTDQAAREALTAAGAVDTEFVGPKAKLPPRWLGGRERVAALSKGATFNITQ